MNSVSQRDQAGNARNDERHQANAYQHGKNDYELPRVRILDRDIGFCSHPNYCQPTTAGFN
jgi:hypothetical protein